MRVSMTAARPLSVTASYIPTRHALQSIQEARVDVADNAQILRDHRMLSNMRFPVHIYS